MSESDIVRLRTMADGSTVRVRGDGREDPYAVPEPRPMTDEEIEMAARADADALPATEAQLDAISVQAVRKRLGLSQRQFASRYRIPVGTLQDWEQARRTPDAPARALLRIIAADPEGAARALAEV